MAKNDLPEGFAIPIHRSLVQPLFWMGVPRNLFLTNVFAGVFIGIFLKAYITAVILTISIHLLFKFLGSKDPQFHLVFLRSKSLKSYYYR